MAASTVNLPERLRPWHASGLLFVFRDAFEQQSAIPEQAPCLDPATQQQVANGNADPVAPAPVPAINQASPFAAPPEQWPEPWRGYWRAARIAPPKRFTLSYPELSLDLSGRADAARRDLLRRLLAGVPALAGNTAFWPHTDHAHSLRSDLDPFLHGVRCIGSQAVLLLADPDHALIAPPQPSQPVGTISAHGLDWFLLPSIHAMLEQTSLFQVCVHQLASLLSA